MIASWIHNNKKQNKSLIYFQMNFCKANFYSFFLFFFCKIAVIATYDN